MNKNTIEKLKAIAPSLEQFRRLEDYEQAWIIPLLHPTAKTALAVLDAITKWPCAIANREMTYQEIAEDLEVHPNTVKQVIYALIDSGCAVNTNGRTAIASTGRPQILARKK